MAEAGGKEGWGGAKEREREEGERMVWHVRNYQRYQEYEERKEREEETERAE